MSLIFASSRSSMRGCGRLNRWRTLCFAMRYFRRASRCGESTTFGLILLKFSVAVAVGLAAGLEVVVSRVFFFGRVGEPSSLFSSRLLVGDVTSLSLLVVRVRLRWMIAGKRLYRFSSLSCSFLTLLTRFLRHVSGRSFAPKVLN